MKVRNMTSNKGNTIANQFIIETLCGTEFFQSYDKIIVERFYDKVDQEWCVKLDETFWDCSKTTRKYRNIFLKETTAETKAKIASGEYLLVNLN